MKIWPQQTVLMMRVPGILTAVPKVGTSTVSIFDDFEVQSIIDPNVRPTFQSNHADELTFSVKMSPFQQSGISREFAELLSELSQLRQSLGTPASSPSSDSLAVNSVSPADDARLSTIRGQIVALLWKDEFAAPPPLEADGVFPTTSLETRISQLLDPQRVKLVAALTGIRPDRVSQSACRLLAREVRRRAGIVEVAVTNLSAPFQTVWINDYTWHTTSHTTTLPLTMVGSEVTEYCTESFSYWTELDTTKLYDDADFALRSKWQQFGRTPLQQVQFECSTWDERDRKLRRSIEALNWIARRTALYFLISWPSPASSMSVEGKSDWLARQAGLALGLTPQEVIGHQLDGQTVLPFVPMYLTILLGNNNLTEFGQSAGDAAQHLSVIIGDLIAQRIVATKYEMRVPGLMGGLTVKPSAWDAFPVISDVFDPPQTPAGDLDVDYSKPAAILGGAYKNPRGINRYEGLLDDWKADADAKATPKKGESLPARIRAFNELVWRESIAKAEVLRTGLQHVARIQDLSRALYALMEPLGYTSIQSGQQGRIHLPPDSTVVSAHADIGEFADAQRPVVTVQHRYRRNGRLLIDDSTLTQLALTSGSVYEVTPGAPIALPTNVKLLAAVHEISPTQDGKWAVDCEIFPAIESATIVTSGPGLPRFLPVQDKLCASEVHLVDSARCAAATNVLPSEGTVQVSFKQKVQ